MLNEYLSPNMKRKILQHLIDQDPQVKVFSKLDDFNAAFVSNTSIPIQKQNHQEYDYFDFANLQVNKIESIVFGIVSNLIEQLTPSSMILNFGSLKFSKSKKPTQASTFLSFEEELSFSQIPPLNATRLYFVLYPHPNHLIPSNDEIEFKVSYPNGFGKNTTNKFSMKYLPPTHIEDKIEIIFRYENSADSRFPWITEPKTQQGGEYFSSKVLSNGVYISKQLISVELWINMLYPKDAQGNHTALKNWWKPIEDLDPKSEFYKTKSKHYPIGTVEDGLLEDAICDDDISKLNPAQPIHLKESITKAFHFCNLLSIKCGLDPYYEFIDTSSDGSGKPSVGSKLWPKEILFKSNANGFRLPTAAELEECLLQEKQEYLEYLERHGQAASKDIQLDSYYQLTQDAAPCNDENVGLEYSTHIFEIEKKDTDAASSPYYKLDKKKLTAKIKEISNSEVYKALVSKRRLQIDPKRYPTDQSASYKFFANYKWFTAKKLDFKFVDNTTTFRISHKPYVLSTVLEDEKRLNSPTRFGFRIVKNKS